MAIWIRISRHGEDRIDKFRIMGGAQGARSIRREALDAAIAESARYDVSARGWDWREHREASASAALYWVEQAMGRLSASANIEMSSRPSFLPSERADSAPNECGVLAWDEARVDFWPVGMRIEWHDGEAAVSPRLGSGVAMAHYAKGAAALLFGGAARSLIAKKSARALFMRWVELGVQDARTGRGPWLSALSAFEREAIADAVPLGDAPRRPATRSL